MCLGALVASSHLLGRRGPDGTVPLGQHREERQKAGQTCAQWKPTTLRYDGVGDGVGAGRSEGSVYSSHRASSTRKDAPL